MIATDEKIALVRDAYAAINDHDLDALGQLLADDCIRRYIRGPAPIAGDHEGREAVLASYRYMWEHTGGDHHLEIGNILANELLAASYHQETATRKRDGVKLDAPMFTRWIVKDGKIAEIWDYANDVPGLNEFLI